ncbi:F-box protein SKP2B-like [Hibiscus syriacus]|uniref:F-box protein SKP2B-like n=1 Tax=Hibiscus syriacus TaxID=106335 RepID=UPI001924C8EB|nr:F-box protein SKP2B-like [Hibiscus syriacus]
MLMLPSLKKLEHLEVFSVEGLESVTDKFIKEFIAASGDGIRELILSGCRKLTDSSLKIIAETCSCLRVLDIGIVPKLKDKYLASGCRSFVETPLQHFQLMARSSLLCFASRFLVVDIVCDDAIAAFLEMSGEALKELALNNVGKVGHNTALSLSRRSRNLVSLDLSWCRNLTDEAMGLIVDRCLSLRVLKLFGCTQITDVFLYGHSNANVEIIGLKLSSLLEHI